VENAKEGGVDGVKNRSGQWEGPGEGGELDGCIMHRVPTSYHVTLEDQWQVLYPFLRII